MTSFFHSFVQHNISIYTPDVFKNMTYIVHSILESVLIFLGSILVVLN